MVRDRMRGATPTYLKPEKKEGRGGEKASTHTYLPNEKKGEKTPVKHLHRPAWREETRGGVPSRKFNLIISKKGPTKISN